MFDSQINNFNILEVQKTYDAFVSYTSSHDEQFVLDQLIPKLESEWKLKLCVHFRDFRPGKRK